MPGPQLEHRRLEPRGVVSGTEILRGRADRHGRLLPRDLVADLNAYHGSVLEKFSGIRIERGNIVGLGFVGVDSRYPILRICILPIAPNSSRHDQAGFALRMVRRRRPHNPLETKCGESPATSFRCRAWCLHIGLNYFRMA